jgi:hypothetical protein
MGREDGFIEHCGRERRFVRHVRIARRICDPIHFPGRFAHYGPTGFPCLAKAREAR